MDLLQFLHGGYGSGTDRALEVGELHPRGERPISSACRVVGTEGNGDVGRGLGGGDRGRGGHVGGADPLVIGGVDLLAPGGRGIGLLGLLVDDPLDRLEGL
jgi:hypothetical protein